MNLSKSKRKGGVKMHGDDVASAGVEVTTQIVYYVKSISMMLILPLVILFLIFQ